jgi:hypothetical protein
MPREFTIWFTVVHGSCCGIGRQLCECEGRTRFGDASYRRFAVSSTTGCNPRCKPEAWVAIPSGGPGDAVPQALIIWALLSRWRDYEIRESDRLIPEWLSVRVIVPGIPEGVSGQALRAWAVREVIFYGLEDGPLDPPSEEEGRGALWYLCVPFNPYPFMDRCVLCIQVGSGRVHFEI